MRATEALSIRICDLDLESNPSKIFVRGEYTKTRSDCTILLTQEIASNLSIGWITNIVQEEYLSMKRTLTNQSLNIGPPKNEIMI